MKSLCLFLLALSAALWASFALAQPAAGANAMDGRCGHSAAASAAAADCPGGIHKGHGMQHPMQGGQHKKSGSSMMSAAERRAHQDKLHSFKNYDECKAYMDEHHAQMMARAKAAGHTPPAMPMRDACAALKSAQP
jgi:hypothetical protein